MANSILQALEMLDPKDDAHWTKDGAPALDALKAILGDDTLKRKTVTEAAPGFSRSHYDIPEPKAPEETPEGSVMADDQAALEAETLEQLKKDKAVLEERAAAGDESAIQALADIADTLGEETLTTTFAPVEELEDTRSPLQKEYDEVNARIASLQKEKTAIQNELNILAKRQHLLDMHVGTKNGKTMQEDQDARMAYIRSQAEIRAKKAARNNQALNALGLGNQGKAPIDQAFAAKRGSARPSGPQIGG